MLKQKGFTLIELLVVSAIIGLLASVVLVSLSGARKKARDARGQSDLRQIATAMEMYYDSNNAYPNLGTTFVPVTNLAALNTYLNPVPTTTGVNVYYWKNKTSTQDFCVYFTLESPSTTTYFYVSNSGAYSTTVQAQICP
jgi:prepilin-type N-terminal cleavage/methylation domain-containing protein